MTIWKNITDKVWSLFEKIPRIVRLILGIVLLHLVTIVLTVELYNATKPVLFEDCVQKTIVVDEKDQDYKIRSSSVFKIRSEDTWYTLYNYGRSGQYTDSEVFDAVSVGDEIEILYVERSSVIIPYKKNLIVGAKKSDSVLMEFKEDDASSAKATGIIVLVIGAIAEGGAIAVTVVLINRERNLRKEERKKKQEELTPDTTTQDFPS